jgi:hypothetical protein
MTNESHFSKELLQALIDEAIVDCYDEDEQFWGMLTALGDELEFPLAVILIGEQVELIGLDNNASLPPRGIVAQVQHKGQIYSVSLADLQIMDINLRSAEWLAAYHYWLRY